MIDLFSPEGVLFLINNLFRVYVVYRFVGAFYDRKGVNRNYEMAAYLAYFAVHSIIYLAFDILPLTMSVNVVAIFLLSFFFKCRVSTKILVTLLIYATGLCVEILIYAVLQAFKFEGDMANLVLFIGSLLLLLIILTIERIKASGEEREIKSKNWITLLFIPIASVIISLVLGVPLTNFRWVAAALLCLLIINFIAFYLYDALGRYFVEENERQLLIQQNEAYGRQFELIQQGQQNIRMLKHDMKNHMMTLNSLLAKGDKQELFAYMKKINANIETETAHVDTGNHYVDSILNYKIEEAVHAGAQVKVDVHIPDKLNIEAFHLNIILGNLMDNAIESIREVDNKKIFFEMALDRSMLFIKVQNHYAGKLKKSGNQFRSTKSNEKFRGIGLRSVQSAVSTYDGTMDIEAEDGLFIVTLLLYNQTNSEPLV